MYRQTTAAATGSDRQRLARKLVRDLVTFAGITTGELVADGHAKPRRRSRRVLFRKELSDGDVDAVVSQIGAERLWSALDRVTQPRCEATAEMFVAANGGAS